MRQKSLISGLLCPCFQNTSDRYKSSSYKAGLGTGGGSRKHEEVGKSSSFCGPVQLCKCSLWDRMRACTLLVQVLCKQASWASAEDGGGGGGFSSLPECRQIPDKTPNTETEETPI